MANLMEPTASEDLDGGTIAKAVFQGITEEDFATSAVDALLSMVQAGHTDVLGDVLVYLAQRQRPDWAAELCRMVLAGPDGAERDFMPVAAAMATMVPQHATAAAQVCSHILEIKDNGYGGSFFDCYDVSFVLGHMAQLGDPAAAGAVLYTLYCDESPQGQMYQTLVPHVLGTLLDRGQLPWAVEIAKHLMYADGENSIDYQPMGWTMAQMAYSGRPDWAAAMCDSLLSQHLWWYNQGAMLQAVGAWDPSYPQAIMSCMTGGSGPQGGRGAGAGWGGRGGGGGHNGHQAGRQYGNPNQQQYGYGGGGGRSSAARPITSPRGPGGGGPGGPGGLTSPTGAGAGAGAGVGSGAPQPKENGVPPPANSTAPAAAAAPAAEAGAAPAAAASGDAAAGLQSALANLTVADTTTTTTTAAAAPAAAAASDAAAPATTTTTTTAPAKEVEGGEAPTAAAATPTPSSS